MTAAFAVTAALFAPPVFAHSYLENASPPVNSTVTVAPSAVTIAFTSAIESRFSTIEVTGAAAQRVDSGAPYLVDGDTKRLAVGLKTLSPGIYTVAWQATSVDTHKTNGSYQFTVAAADASDISLEHVWARATAGNATTGAAYLTVTDRGSPDRLVGVSTPIATAELHETINDNGVMKMRPVAGIALEPGKPVTFAPGGYHVMLMGLKGPLKAGDSFPLTLTFQHTQPITVTAHVEAIGGGGMDHGHDAMQGMQGMAPMQGQMGQKP
jgi:copper(I)-binding protein